MKYMRCEKVPLLLKPNQITMKIALMQVEDRNLHAKPGHLPA